MENEHEIAALAMVAIGMLTVAEDGRIWKTRELDRAGNEVVLVTPKNSEAERAGYRRVQITVAGHRYWASSHRVVWMVTNQRLIPAGMEVNHIDGNRGNNRPGNLELVTKAHNQAHGLHVLGHMSKRATSGAKLTPTQVLEIRDLVDAGTMSKAAIARHFGVTAKTIRNIQTRAKWGELLGPTASTG